MKRAFLPLAFLACALLASASDFGLVLSAAPRYGSSDGFELTAAATPWFSALQGETGSLFLSAMLQLEADDNGTRLEFDIRRFQYRTVAASGMILDVGRFFVSDCSGLVVSGFLDGVRVELPGDLGTFRSGVYYTGLFNKDTNYLYLSPGDKADLADPDRFFSASRAVAAAAYTRRSIFGENTLSVETLWQFDLRSGGGWLHSQYLAAALSGPLAERLTYRASLAASLVEEMNKSTAPAAAAAFDVAWLPAGKLADKVYGELRWGSGAKNEVEGSAFLPLTANPQGAVFDVRLSGFFSARGGYSARLSESLAVDVSTAVFLRTGRGVNYTGLDETSDSAFLGVESFGSVRFAPVSDFSASLGAGVFLPNSGGAFESDTAPTWLVSASVVLTL